MHALLHVAREAPQVDAEEAPPAQGAPTAVSRAAGMALTKVLANEGAPHNVLVNGLMVGKIESDQWVRRHANEDQGESLDDYYARQGAALPMGRYGTAEEFAAAACFLASDAVDIVLKRGQISLHDVYLMHGSEPNRSSKQRRGMTMRMMPTTSLYDRDAATSLYAERGQTDMSKHPVLLLHGEDRCGRNLFTPMPR